MAKLHHPKVKIGLIANYGSAGGISSQVDLLNKNLRLENFEVTLISTRSNLFLKPFVLIYTILKSRECDVLHIHGCSWFGFLPVAMGVLAGKLLRKKIVITYHGGEVSDFLDRFMFVCKPILFIAKKITVPSQYLKSVFDERGINVDVVPNILDIENFPYCKRKQIRPKLLIVKHLEQVYNIKMGIMAFGIVKNNFPDAELKIVGSGSQENKLRALVKELGLNDSVCFLGVIDHNKIAGIYKESDIFLNCSIFESFGMVLLEAMASGLPVVSTNVGGIPSIIEDRVNGFLVEPDDYQGMAKSIISLLENQEIVNRVVINGRQKSEEHTWEGIRQSIISLYESDN
ncbi:MAG: glycosyltransferase family 4 protein [Candidatus Altiarchaeota archaeon]|nr:glycosyltransferase family 4 protein [Candidatus Altiarchaeota archaeon]